ncbi:MAG: hypothetical protein ABIN69_07300 [Aestuariivirga sp.]
MKKRIHTLEELTTANRIRMRRKKILCARVPQDAPTARIEELAAQAEEQEADFRCYVWDRLPEGDGTPLPKYYVLHPFSEMPEGFEKLVMQEHRNAQHS